LVAAATVAATDEELLMELVAALVVDEAAFMLPVAADELQTELLSTFRLVP
jgi:hypothetical protein